MKKPRQPQKIATVIIWCFSLFMVAILLIMSFISYYYSYANLQERTIADTDVILSQVGKNIGRYIANIESISGIINTNKDVMDYLENPDAAEAGLKRTNFKNFLNYLPQIDNNIVSIFVFDLNNHPIYFPSNLRMKINYDITQDEWYKKIAEETTDTPYLTGTKVRTMTQAENPWVISLSRRIVNRRTGEVMGSQLVELNYSVIDDILNEINLGSKGYIFIIDRNGDMVYHPQLQLVYSGLKSENIPAILASESTVLKLPEENKLYSIGTIPGTNFTIVGVTFLDEIVAMGSEMITLYMILTLIMALAAFVGSVQLAKYITRPLSKLELAANEVEQGNLDANFNIRGTQETEKVASSLSSMIGTVKQLMDQILEDQEMIRSSELKTLQSQINPHFLYNTLDSIVWIAEETGNSRIKEITVALADYFRIQKSFPGVHALDDAQIDLKKGEVHGLVGENGAGKSTLMKVLTGIYAKDSGSVTVKGREVHYASPGDALGDGISMIHQELNLMPHLTVADNIFIGREPKKGLVLDKKKIYEMTKDLLASLNLDIDPNIQVNRLTVAKQQMIEIAKALSFNSDIMIMDEPTAALTNTEIDELFKFIGDLKAKGVGIVYISHRMEELKIITDDITVMRDGQYVDTVRTSDTDMDDIISMMVGRTIYEKPKTHSTVAAGAPTVLKVEHLSSPDVHDVSFELKKGEILGFAGLMGAGRTETARLVFGADPKTEGKITINGTEVHIASPTDAVAHGIGYLSEDRKRFGLAVGLSVADNTVMADMGTFTHGGVVNEPKIAKITQEYVDKLDLKTPSIRQLVRNLSGGNQQKVVIAKWLVKNCDILIFDEPTRGIDVGAKSEIYKLMNQLASEGKSIIMISSEMPELLRMSDRVIVMCEGKMTGEIDIGEATQEGIMKFATQRNEAR